MYPRPMRVICPRENPFEPLVIGIAREVRRDLEAASPPMTPDCARLHIEKLATEFLISQLTNSFVDELLLIPCGDLAAFLVLTVEAAKMGQPSLYEERFFGLEFSAPILDQYAGAERLVGHALETVVDAVAGELFEYGWGIARNRPATAL